MPVFIITLLRKPKNSVLHFMSSISILIRYFVGPATKRFSTACAVINRFLSLEYFLSDNGGQLLSLPRVLQSAKLYVYGIYCGMAFGRTIPHVVVTTSSCARLFASSFCCIASLHFCAVSKILPSKTCTLIRRGKGCFIIQSLLIS